MKIRRYLHRYFILFAALNLLASLNSPAAWAEEAAGAIVGLVADSAALPIAHATVTAREIGGTGFRATISGSDGVYSFSDLPPGRWSVSSQVEGYLESADAVLAVAPNKAVRLDIAMLSREAGPAKEASSFAALAKEAIQKATAAVTPAAPGSSTSRVSASSPAVPTIPEALQAPDPAPENDTVTPLANVGDIGRGYMNGTGSGGGT